MKKLMILLIMTVLSVELQAPRRKADRKDREEAHKNLGSNLEAWRNSTKDILDARTASQNPVQVKQK
jgi:hypothetical protein